MHPVSSSKSRGGKVLRMFDTRCVFESGSSGSCLQATQIKEGGKYELVTCDRSQLQDLGGPSQVMPFEAIFGIYELLSGYYVALVVESEPYVSIPIFGLRKAKKILVVPLFRNGRVLSESKQRDENRYLQLLHMAFSEHQFFFSITHHVTLTQQRIAKLTPSEANGPVYACADARFFWNGNLLMDLIAIQANEWIVPFMSAHVEYRPDLEIDGTKFSMLFVTRRSRLRQGCRFTKRGIDEHGNVANFCETEQILLFPDGKITSFVQVRGSIPLLWASPVCMKYEPAVYIDQEHIKESREYAQKHADNLCDLYADNSQPKKSGITFVNLIDMKSDQKRLGLTFKEVFDHVEKLSCHRQNLKYVWFDFHAETKKKGKWSNLYKLMEVAEDAFRAHRWFCKQADGTVTEWQVGVLRTNCMDNLDRTNVVQSLFARRNIMVQLNKTTPGDIKPTTALDSPYKSFEKIFKAVWANNADAVSIGYAGTGALKTDFTRTGKVTWRGKFNDGVHSLMRYYKNNLTDGVKQDSIDLLVGNYKPDPAGSSPFTDRPGQESLSTNLVKAFVLMITVFSALMLLSPGLNDSTSLTTHLVVSFAVTALVFLFVLFRVVKKGATVGERIVNHPCLLPEARQR